MLQVNIYSATAFPVGQQKFVSEFAFRNFFWFCRLYMWYGWIYCSVLFMGFCGFGLFFYFPLVNFVMIQNLVLTET